MIKIGLFSVALLMAAGCRSSMDHTIQERSARVREYIARETKSDAPGIQYLVCTPDSTLFSFANGSADLASGRPLEEKTTMMIYSMSKTITAAAVLQLVEQGKIALDDPISDYVSDLPYQKKITIRHLLAQMSGIPNPIPLRWVHLVEEHPRFDEEASLRAILRENGDLDFEPGEKYGYSNISYWLLGKVISKASGISYEDYLRQSTFRRLKIPESEIDFVIPQRENHSKGYLPKWSFLNLFKSFVIDSRFVGEYEDGWLHINDHYLNGPAFGGIVATARAIGMFLQDQISDSSKLFSTRTRQLFFEQQKATDGTPVEMTLGWHIGQEEGVQFFFKEGGGGGFHAEMRIYPDQRIASVVIANNTSFNVKKFLNTADREFFRKGSIDSVVQFLLTSAATDFHTHGPSRPLRFRDVRLGSLAAASGTKQYLLCGEALLREEGGKEVWIPFATIKTSGYEQWIGNQATAFCQGSSVVWEEAGDLSALLESRLDSLR